MGISQLSMFDDRSVATPTFTSPPDGSLFSPRSQRCHIPGLCGTGSGNMRQPVIRLISKQLEIPNDLNLENTHSSKISETLLQQIQTGSWNWLLCRMEAVGVWIIPRIRTGLKPLDDQIGHHYGWTPSYRAQASLRLHNLPLQDMGRLTKLVRLVSRKLWELVKFVNRPSTGWERKQILEATATGDTSTNWLVAGELVDAGGSVLTATARTARHARFSELRMLQFCAFHWISMFEKIVQCLDERGFVVKAKTLSILF